MQYEDWIKWHSALLEFLITTYPTNFYDKVSTINFCCHISIKLKLIKAEE